MICARKKLGVNMHNLPRDCTLEVRPCLRKLRQCLMLLENPSASLLEMGFRTRCQIAAAETIAGAVGVIAKHVFQNCLHISHKLTQPITDFRNKDIGRVLVV